MTDVPGTPSLAAWDEQLIARAEELAACEDAAQILAFYRRAYGDEHAELLSRTPYPAAFGRLAGMTQTLTGIIRGFQRERAAGEHYGPAADAATAGPAANALPHPGHGQE